MRNQKGIGIYCASSTGAILNSMCTQSCVYSPSHNDYLTNNRCLATPNQQTLVQFLCHTCTCIQHDRFLEAESGKGLCPLLCLVVTMVYLLASKYYKNFLCNLVKTPPPPMLNVVCCGPAIKTNLRSTITGGKWCHYSHRTSYNLMCYSIKLHLSHRKLMCVT